MWERKRLKANKCFYVDAMQNLLVDKERRWTLPKFKNEFEKDKSNAQPERCASGLSLTKWIGEVAPCFHVVLPNDLPKIMLKQLQISTPPLPRYS